jgi:hypothetical protein
VGMVWQAGAFVGVAEGSAYQQPMLPAVSRVRVGPGEIVNGTVELPGSPGEAVLAAMDEDCKELQVGGGRAKSVIDCCRAPSPVSISPFSAPIAQQGVLRREQVDNYAEASVGSRKRREPPVAAGPSSSREQQEQQQSQALVLQHLQDLSQQQKFQQSKQRRQSCPEVICNTACSLHQQQHEQHQQQDLGSHLAPAGMANPVGWAQQCSMSVELQNSRFAATSASHQSHSEQLPQLPSMQHRSPLGIAAAAEHTCSPLLKHQMLSSSPSGAPLDGIRKGGTGLGIGSNSSASKRQTSKRFSVLDDLQPSLLQPLSAWGSACMSKASSMMGQLARHGSTPEQLEHQKHLQLTYHQEVSSSRPGHRRTSSSSASLGVSTMLCSRQGSVPMSSVPEADASMSNVQQQDEQRQQQRGQQPWHSDERELLRHGSISPSLPAVALGEQDGGHGNRTTAAPVPGAGGGESTVCTPSPTPRAARRQRRRSFMKVDIEGPKQQNPEGPNTPQKRPGSNCSNRLGAPSPELADDMVVAAALLPNGATSAPVRGCREASNRGTYVGDLGSDAEASPRQHRAISSDTLLREWEQGGCLTTAGSPRRRHASRSMVSMVPQAVGAVRARLPLLGFEGLSDPDDDDRSPRCVDGGRMHVSPAGVSRPGSPWRGIAQGSAVVKQVAKELAQGGDLSSSASKLILGGPAQDASCEPTMLSEAANGDENYPLSDDYHSGLATDCSASHGGSMGNGSGGMVVVQHGSSGMDMDVDGTKRASLGNVSSTSIGDSAALRGAADMAFAGFSAFNVKACQERNQEKIIELTKQWEEAAQQEAEEEKAITAAALQMQQQAALNAALGGPVLMIPKEAGPVEPRAEGQGIGSGYASAASYMGDVAQGAEAIGLVMPEGDNGEGLPKGQVAGAPAGAENALHLGPAFTSCLRFDSARMSADGSHRASSCRSSLDGYRGTLAAGPVRPHSMRRLSLDNPVRGMLHVAHSAGMAPLVIPPHSGGSSGLHSPHPDAMTGGCIGLQGGYVPTVPLSPMPVQGMAMIPPWAEPLPEGVRTGLIRGAVASKSGALPSARRSEVWLGASPPPPWEGPAAPEFAAQHIATTMGVPQCVGDALDIGVGPAEAVAGGVASPAHAVSGGSRRCSCSAEVAETAGNGTGMGVCCVGGRLPPIMVNDMHLCNEADSGYRSCGDTSAGVGMPDAGTNEWQQNLVQQAFRYSSSVALGQQQQEGLLGLQGSGRQQQGFGDHILLGRQSSSGLLPCLSVAQDSPPRIDQGSLGPSCGYAVPGCSFPSRGSCSPSSGVQVAPCVINPAAGCGCCGNNSPWGTLQPGISGCGSFVPRLSDPSGCCSGGRVCYSSDGAPALQLSGVGASSCIQNSGVPPWCGGVGSGSGLSAPNTPGNSSSGGALYGAPFPLVRMPQLSDGGAVGTPAVGPSTSMYRALLDSVPDGGRKYAYRMSDTGTATGQLSRFASMLANSNYSPNSSNGGMYGGSQQSAARGDDVAAAAEVLTRHAALAASASMRRRTGTIPSDILTRRFEGAPSSGGSTSGCNSPQSSPGIPLVGRPSLAPADKQPSSAELPELKAQQHADGEALGSQVAGQGNWCGSPGTLCGSPGTLDPAGSLDVATAGIAPHQAEALDAVLMPAAGGGRSTTLQRASRLSYPGTS